MGPGVGPDSPGGAELDLAHAYIFSDEGMPMLYRHIPTADGANVIQWTAHGGDDQLFRFE